MTLVKLENAPVTRADSGGEPHARLLYALNVDQYHQMMREGILPEGESLELVEGQVVRIERNARGSDPMTVGPGHSVVCNRLYRLGPKLKRLGCHIRVQQPVTIATYNEPQPDGAIVRGTDEDYAERHPGPKEVACAIEVADATLSFDRTTKQRVYANARIEQYVIINLVEHVVEVYARPMVGRGRYAEVVSLKPGEKATLMAGQGKLLTIPAKQLLL